MTPPTGGAWAPERRLLTVGLVGLVTAAAFEGMAVPTVLPLLVGELGGLDLYGWAFSAFWLTTIIGITLGGADADRRGPAPALVAGVVLFAVGLLIAGLAPNMAVVIGGRAIQGFGAGAMSAVVYAAIARAYPAHTTPRMIALVSSAWVVPGLIGPALAGTVADTIGWRWVFLSVVPMVLVMGAAITPQLAPLGAAVSSASPTRSARGRAMDATLLAVGSALLLWALTVGVPLVSVVLLLGGGWLVVLALRHLLPKGSLRLARGRPSVMALGFGVAFAFLGAEAFVPLAVVEIRGGSAALGGLALSTSAVTWAAGSWIQARAAGAGVRRVMMAGGAALIAVGIATTATVLLPGMPVFTAALGWAIAGLGMGLAYSTSALVMLETAEPGQEGFSSSALQLVFTLGTALGAGVGGAVVAVADAGVIDLATALAIVYGITAGVALLAALIAQRVPSRGPARPRGDVTVPAVALPGH
ncbi:MAG TPA: MFS transporter [Candidatus Limnocylindria bacterium]